MNLIGLSMPEDVHFLLLDYLSRTADRPASAATSIHPINLEQGSDQNSNVL